MFFVKLSFQEWTQQVQDMLNTKKFGDIAFRDKDFKNAIEYYSKVCSHILFVENQKVKKTSKEFSPQNNSHRSYISTSFFSFIISWKKLKYLFYYIFNLVIHEETNDFFKIGISTLGK